MTRPATRRPSRGPKPRIAPPDGTRERLLQAAGETFAEKGYERTTAKEIAKRAAINAAAVNYYFGGIDELYLAVIEEARSKAVTFDKLSNAMAGIDDPIGKLRAILEFMVELAIGPFSSSWMARIFARELAAPSPLKHHIHWRDFEKRINLMRDLIAEYLGLAKDDPDVAYVLWCLASPITVLLTSDRKRFAWMYPEIDLRHDNAATIAEHLARFGMGGLEAVRQRRQAPASTHGNPGSGNLRSK